jgi:hypothetical protein
MSYAAFRVIHGAEMVLEELESCVANALFAARDSPSWSYRYEPAGRRKEEVLSVQEPASSSTSTKPFVASAFTGHEEYDDIVNQSRRIAGDFGHISPGEKEMTVQIGPKQPDNNNNNTAGTSPMADLGAQTSCGTLAGASLLPAVIAKALNSRATNASSCSHTCNNLNFRTSTPSAIASLLPLTCSVGNCITRFGLATDCWQKTGNMGYNVNRFKGGARTRRSESSGQSQKAHCALGQVPVTGNTTRNEQLPMTNQPARAVLLQLSQVSLTFLFRSRTLFWADSILMLMGSQTKCVEISKDIQVDNALQHFQHHPRKYLDQIMTCRL